MNQTSSCHTGCSKDAESAGEAGWARIYCTWLSCLGVKDVGCPVSFLKSVEEKLCKRAVSPPGHLWHRGRCLTYVPPTRWEESGSWWFSAKRSRDQHHAGLAQCWQWHMVLQWKKNLSMLKLCGFFFPSPWWIICGGWIFFAGSFSIRLFLAWEKIALS